MWIKRDDRSGGPASYPAPDVDYTYWDNNSPFLAYANEQHIYNSGGSTTHVVLPSYHRPQYLRSLASSGITPADWYRDSSTVGRVMRPHVEHLAVAPNGEVTNTKRFISATYPDSRPSVPAADRLASFPFTVDDGLWSATGAPDYDADPDGDGKNEAIWMDLGYPMQVRENPDGTVTKYVPMWGITIIDADALFNLNAHGNTSGTDASNSIITNNFGQPFGYQRVGLGADGLVGGGDDTLDTRFISQSNQATSVSEVNPQWGLHAALPGTGMDQHNWYMQKFGRDTGADPLSQTELANLEWWWLLTGRLDLDSSLASSGTFPGRWGEETRLENAFNAAAIARSFPGPGERNVDDNSSARLGGLDNDQFSILYPNTITFPAWRHPLDLRGRGRYTTFGSNGQDRMFRQSGTGLYRFPQYAFYQSNTDTGLYQSFTKTPPYFLPGFETRFHTDEPGETILEPALARNDLDSIFGAGENGVLHISEFDQTTLGLSGRVRDLAPINLGGTDPAAEYRRRLFTTTSWDLKSHSKTKYDDSLASTAPQLRHWEFSDTGSGVRDTFPPIFGSTYNTAQDPFRRPVRDLLAVTHGNTGRYIQRKLSLNQLCDFEPGTGKIRFRPLTPHPANLPPERLQTTTSTDPNFTTQPTRPEQISNADPDIQKANQEYLARRDRQQFCRDIYVLLYTFCESSNSDTTSSNFYSTKPDLNTNGIPDDLELIAQFAVNLVDQLDPDNIITKFEYDIDLSDGWNLNDDPYDENAQGSSTSSEAATTRGVAYGVEMQQLTLGEAQVVYTKRIDDAQKDHKATQWDETDNHDFTYVELENVSPYAVDFNTEAWQITVVPDINKQDVTDPMNPVDLVFTEERRLTLNGNTPSVGTGSNSRLLIATASDDDITNGAAPNSPSHILIDTNYDPMMLPDPTIQSDYTRVVPKESLLTGTNVVDLVRTPNAYKIHKAQAGKYGDGARVLASNSPPAGTDLLSISTPTDPDSIAETDDRQFSVKFTLRRRLNPHRDTPPDNEAAVENPWITVDELTVRMDVFTLTSSSAAIEKIQEQLTGKDPTDPATMFNDSFKSRARTEPLANVNLGNHNNFVSPTATAPALYANRNTLGRENRNASGLLIDEYLLYQPQFDRDYSSVFELFNLPLYGPDKLTQQLGVNFTRATVAQHDVNFNTTLLAGNRFLNEPMAYWYRLFEFVEVPGRSPQYPAPDTYGNNNNLLRPDYVIDSEGRWSYRKPGQVQLNTLRNAEVLAGVLDDVEVINADQTLTDVAEETALPGDPNNRKWWTEFLRSRDGRDPDPGTTNNFYMPGLPVAKPFRNMGYSAQGNLSQNLEHTLLRTRPTSTSQRLFQINGTSDPTLRYRMLEKVMNNSTTRSNVFLIFIQVDFFQADDNFVDSGSGLNVVRVGSKLASSPGYRGFFVVDRSKIVEVLTQMSFEDQNFNPQTHFLPQQFTDPVDGLNKNNFSFNQDFDYQRLILHRQTIK